MQTRHCLPRQGRRNKYLYFSVLIRTFERQKFSYPTFMADKSVITNLENRIGRLIEDHRRLRSLSKELVAERDALRSANRTLEERVRELDAELARMQLTEGLSGESRNRDKARARVNRLMREVDKCIALLDRPQAAPATENAVDAEG